MLIDSLMARSGAPDPSRDHERRGGGAGAAAGLLAGALLAAVAAPAQPAPVTPPADPRLVMGERVSVDWVLVPVVVESGGEHVRDLPRDAFQLSVDGRRIPVVDFEQGADAPVDLVFLQDLSGSMELDRGLELSRRALDCLLGGGAAGAGAAGGGSRFALASFTTGRVALEVPFTADPGRLRAAAADWHAWGTTAIHDAVTWLPEIAIVGGNDRRAAVLITDGVDNASEIDPATARERVRRADLPVYVIALQPSPAAREDDGTYRYRDVLGLLAEVTGGEVHAADGTDGIDRACRAIADDLRHQYVLGFPTAGGGADAYRRIRVVVTGGDHQVTYRQGYHGRPPGDGGPAPGVRQ